MSKQKKILVVDDDLGMCETLTDILEGEGYEVVTANDGYQAVELTTQNCFDFVLMDIRMPGMTGVEACKIMRNEKPDLKVILMTAYAVEVLVAEAIKELAVKVVSKPLDIDNVLNMIKNSRKN